MIKTHKKTDKKYLLFFVLAVFMVVTFWLNMDESENDSIYRAVLVAEKYERENTDLEYVKRVDKNDNNELVEHSQQVAISEKFNTNEWMDSSGYSIFEQLYYPNASEDEKAGYGVNNDYITYDKETLQALSDSGDPTAAFILGSLEEDAQRAMPLLRQSLIKGKYTASIHQIAAHYDLLSFSENGEPLIERIKNDEPIELTDNDKQYLAWLAFGNKINDPVSKIVSKSTRLNKLIDSEEISLLAENIFREVNAELSMNGLPQLEARPDIDSLNERFKKLYDSDDEELFMVVEE